MSALRPLLNEVIQIELRQIRCLTMLGCMAADAFTRDIVFSMIMEEAGEAKFWNTVDAAYCGVQTTGGCPDICPGTWPGMPGTCPTPGMPGTCPNPGMPGTCPNPGMPDTWPGMPGTCPDTWSGPCPMPGMPGTCPNPGMPGTCPNPGMPDTWPGMPGTCPNPGMPGTSPGMSPGGTTTPAWNPAPGMGLGQGFYSKEAQKGEKDKKE